MFIEFGDILLHIFLVDALYREDCLSFLFAKTLTIVNRNDVRWLETLSDQFIQDVLSVGQLKLEMIFNPL